MTLSSTSNHLAPEVKAEFEKAYAWLKIENENHLGVAVKTLIKQLGDNLAQNNAVECWALIDKIGEVVNDASDNLETAEALVECGRAAFILGNYERALQLINMAHQEYRTQYHQIAATKWMIGVILWLIPSRHNDAIKAWEYSRKHFEQLINRPAARREDGAWYRKQCAEMNKIIIAWVNQDGPPSAPSAPSAPPTPQPAAQAAPQRPSPQPSAPASQPAPPTKAPAPAEAEASYSSHYLELYSISASIPAGGFGPMGYDPNPMGHVHVERIYINDKAYRVVNLGLGTIINLQERATYTTLLVKGDSMNQSSPVAINDGDYVLLKQQSVGDPNDIVAAEVVGVDPEATLKRLKGHGKNRRLEAESSNPKYNNDPRFRGAFEIRGVAVAIFKPIP